MGLLFDQPVNQVELSYLEALVAADKEDQRAVQRARDYYNGNQIVFLTARMREYLNLSNQIDDFHLNIIQTIVIAVLDELSVNGFDTSEVANAEGVKIQSQWARMIWDANRMNLTQHTIHEAALRDKVSYVLVDFSEETRLPRLTWHETYISTEAGGNGTGFWLVYRDGDVAFAVYEWTEYNERNGMPWSYMRRNLYYPDRVEKYYRDPDWKQYFEFTIDEDGNEQSKAWPTPWVDSQGNPLGIPVIAFPNFGNTPEAKEALVQQDAINKLMIDVLAEADAAFKIFFLKGEHATTDGKPLTANGSNQLTISPMTILSTLKTDAALTAIEGGDPTKLMATLKDIILIVAQITGTPVSNFIVTRQIAGDATLKGQDKPLSKKVEKRKDIFGQSYADVMRMARKVANAFGATGLDESVSFITIWKQVFDLETIKMMREVLGLSQETLWRLYGLSEEQISAEKETDEYRSKAIALRMQEIELEQLEAGANRGT